MGKINAGRVLLAGLVAGLILNIGEFLLNGVIMAKQMEEQFFHKFNLAPPGASSLAILFAITFAMGVVMVFVYAAIRPRFGAGPKTAAIAGLAAWFSVYVYSNIGGFALGLVPAKTAVIVTAWGLLEYLLAALIGAALYKEP